MTGAVPEAFCTSWLVVGIDASGSVSPNSSLLAMACVARLIYRAPEVFMQWQSRQQLKLQALLAQRARFMRVAAAAAAGLASDEQALYLDLIESALSKAARKAFEMLPETYQFQGPSYLRGRSEGLIISNSN